MKINYVPGLALRLFPGLSREPYDAFFDYISTDAKIAIYTGTAPTEAEMTNLVDFEAYKTANVDNLVYSETTSLKFTYNPLKQERIIQRWPIDSTKATVIVPVVEQDLEAKPEAIKTENSMYAMVYCKDKDTTLNIQDNDLIMLIPGVGTSNTDFVSLSKLDFAADDIIDFRNMTISLFQGYQITDTPITEQQEDPENSGEFIDVVIDTKKSIYYNMNWANRLTEAYRDCFISKEISKYSTTPGNTTTPVFGNTISSKLSLLNGVDTTSGITAVHLTLKKYDTTTNEWSPTLTHGIDTTLIHNAPQNINYAVLGNESLVELLNEINYKSLNSLFPDAKPFMENADRIVYVQGTPPGVSNAPFSLIFFPEIIKKNIIPVFLYNIILQYIPTANQGLIDSVTQLLIEFGFDTDLINRAFKSLISLKYDLTSITSVYDKNDGILTVHNSKPIPLEKRYKQPLQNPTNERLYIILPRIFAKAAFQNEAVINFNHPNNGYSSRLCNLTSTYFTPTQRIIDGENITATDVGFYLNDFTAISIGQTGNGQTDIEYDIIDTIDYIDSLTVMLKLPNKF